MKHNRTITPKATRFFAKRAIIENVSLKIIDMAVSEINWRDLPSDVAATTDGEDYYSELRTGPKFGCIHFEPKDKGNETIHS